jgi:iron complex transport system substrate-binding protein
MRHPRAGRAALIAVVLLSGFACTREARPLRLDGRGTPACVDASLEARRAAARIVSLLPSVTEILVALGAGDRLVARTDYDTDPTLALLPSVGGGLNPSLERLTLLRPDLVVGWSGDHSLDELARHGVLVYRPQSQTLADVRCTMLRLGRALGLETAADSLTGAIDGELAGVRRAVQGRPRPSVFYVVWFDPPMTAGPGTFLDELIDIAGGQNVFADAPSPWPTVSLEGIVRRQPAVVIVPRGERGAERSAGLRTTPGWRDLRAVRAGRVIEVDADVFNRPGPRVGKAARTLARLLHPEAFLAAATP